LPMIQAPITARVISLQPEALTAINGVYLAEGRMITTDHTNGILLLKPFADAHGLKPDDSISVTMNGVKHKFTIAGLALSPEFVYAIPPGEFVIDAGRYAIVWVGKEAMEAAYDLDGAFNEAVMTLSRGADEKKLLNILDRLLAPYGATGAYSRADQISNKYLVEELAQLEIMGRVMTPIFLGVSIFLLNIVITRLVQTEREQIGLLKAFGYSNWSVGVHYLKFAMVIAIGGAFVGWAGGLYLGRLISGIYQNYFHFPFLVFSPEIRMLGVAFVISALAAGFGAFIAVRAATQLSPAVAMRPPAPPKYNHVGGFGRMVEERLDQPSRMILRRLARRPARAGLTVLGIGAAMGLSVMMRFNINATDYMLDVSFNVSDRSDILVTFTESLSEKTLLELVSIDGVAFAEPFRTTPVLFSNKRIDYLGSISGLPANPVLNRAVDHELRPVQINGGGIVLSKQLADILKISVGELLAIEVRHGRRPQLELPVIGIVEALIGTPAYMNMEVLNRQLKEPNRISGAYLKINPRKRTEVYNELKSIPSIAGVSLRREAYNSFKKMIDEGPGTFRTIMTFFSIVIAAGVVYNSARITYIEREHDLASLRVLGFTKIETGYVLLGELGVLVILALPIGSLIGYLIWSYLAGALSTDLYQIPVIYKENSLGFAALIVLFATVVSGAFVQRDVAKLDMASALKTGE
jgi:putative ABC transport system permease protein